MNLRVRKTERFTGVATVPGSKSQSIRALILATMARGESRLDNILVCDDTRDAQQVCRQLGAQLTVRGNQYTLVSDGLPLVTTATTLYTGNSGITTRFVLPLLGLRQNGDQAIVLDCGEQMRARPIRPLVEALRTLGMQIEYLGREGILPLKISGSLRGGAVEVDGITSQYTSALLLSLPCAPEDSVITVRNLHERPYVLMTLKWLEDLGITLHHEQRAGVDIFKIPGRQNYPALTVSIAGDFSSASYPIAAAALIPGEVELRGLDMDEPQGDKRIVNILQQMGADITVQPQALLIRGGKPLQNINIDANDIPDLVPTLAAIATQAAGTMQITNVKQARIKETDRIHSMREGLAAMGAQIEEHDDGLTIHHSTLHGTVVKGYGDHRTVMALALAGMMAEGETRITEAESVAKTFPSFVRLMTSLGASMQTDAHIVLMGFKHVGKSVIGRDLALQLHVPFYELDTIIESMYADQAHKSLTCRQIVAAHGEDYFRKLETEALERTLQQPGGVLALGGGAVMRDANRSLIRLHIPVHITAPRDIVRDRVTKACWPQLKHFDEIWEARDPVYRDLAQVTVENANSVEETVAKIMGQLK